MHNIAFTPSYTDRARLEKNFYIQTFYGVTSELQNFFCYIKCDMEGYRKMQNDFLNQISARPAAYGEVIYIDDIPEPNEKAKLFLQNWLKRNNT